MCGLGWSGERSMSVAALQRRARANPDDTRILKQLGAAHFRSGSAERGGDAFLWLARVYEERNETKKAVSIYGQVLEHLPNRLDVRRRLGVLFYRIGRRSEAVEQLEQVVRAYESRGRLYDARELIAIRALAALYLEQGTPALAARCLRPAHEQNPMDRVTAEMLQYADFETEQQKKLPAVVEPQPPPLPKPRLIRHETPAHAQGTRRVRFKTPPPPPPRPSDEDEATEALSQDELQPAAPESVGENEVSGAVPIAYVEPETMPGVQNAATRDLPAHELPNELFDDSGVIASIDIDEIHAESGADFAAQSSAIIAASPLDDVAPLDEEPPIPAQASERAMTCFQRGLVLKNMRLYEEAIDEFKAATASSSLVAAAWVMIGHCYLELGDAHRALGAFVSAVSLGKEANASEDLNKLIQAAQSLLQR